MKKEEGVIVEVTESAAIIKVGKHNECKSCGACPGNDSAIITVKNTIGAAPGQRVIFEMTGANPVKGAFIIFMLPLIGIFMGALSGGFLADFIGLPVTAGRFLGGAAAFIIIAFFIKVFDNYVSRKGKSLPEIIRVLEN